MAGKGPGRPQAQVYLTPKPVLFLGHVVLQFTAQLITGKKWLSPVQTSGIVLKVRITKTKQAALASTPTQSIPWLPMLVKEEKLCNQSDLRKTHQPKSRGSFTHSFIHPPMENYIIWRMRQIRKYNHTTRPWVTWWRCVGGATEIRWRDCLSAGKGSPFSIFSSIKRRWK